MTQLTKAEQGNYDWLQFVIKENSGYPEELKIIAQKNIEKFELKMKL